jgi:RNA polymerase sigma factor (sigma-70 family)
VFGFCVNQLGSRDEAEDAVQSTFLNAHRALQRGVTPEAELAWLFKIAHNVCLTRRRSSRRRGRVEAPSDLDAVQDVLPAPARESADELIRLTDALSHMPDNQRRAILLREWQGLSYHEIADELQLSQSAVETLIFRARRTLAANLETEPERPSAVARMRRILDIGSLLGGIKTLIVATTAMQATAAAVAVSGAAVVATSPAVRHHAPPAKHAPAPAIVQPKEPAIVEPVVVADPPAQVVRTPVREAAKPKPKPVAAKPKPVKKGPPAAKAPVVVHAAPAPAPAANAPAVSAPQPSAAAPTTSAPEQPKAETPAPARTDDRGENKNKDNGKAKEQPKADAPPAAAAPEKSGHGNGGGDKNKGDKGNKGKGDKGNKGEKTGTTNFEPPAGPVVTPPATTAEPTTAAPVETPPASDANEGKGNGNGNGNGGDNGNRGKGKHDE